jgi:hypothetical protein
MLLSASGFRSSRLHPSMTRTEESVYRIVERFGGRINSATLRVSSQSSDALDRLIRNGELCEIGYAVEIVPEAVREPYKQESRPQLRAVSKPRRPSYSPLTGHFPARIRQLAARIVHWIENHGDQDGEGRPTCDKRSLERGLHANRLPEWKPAIDSLLSDKSIAIEGQQVILMDIDCQRELPDPFDPIGTKRAKELKQARRQSRRKRPLSAWVRQKIAERGGEIPIGR